MKGDASGAASAVDGAIGVIATDIDSMDQGVHSLAGSVYGMNGAMNRMTMDMGRVGNAFANPMSFMFPF